MYTAATAISLVESFRSSNAITMFVTCQIKAQTQAMNACKLVKLRVLAMIS